MYKHVTQSTFSILFFNSSAILLFDDYSWVGTQSKNSICLFCFVIRRNFIEIHHAATIVHNNNNSILCKASSQTKCLPSTTSLLNLQSMDEIRLFKAVIEKSFRELVIPNRNYPFLFGFLESFFLV
jgi:hypothetical protein